MNFIEHWFHVSPDAGSGLTEMSVIGTVLLAAVVVWQLRPGAARGVVPSHPAGIGAGGIDRGIGGD